MKRLLVATHLAWVGLTFIAGIGSAGPLRDWQQALVAARKEGKVVVSVPSNAELRKRMEGVFEQRFPGIDLELVPGRGSKNVRRIADELKAGVRYFDIHIGGSLSMLIGLVRVGVVVQVANCVGAKNWADALSFANNLADGQRGLTDVSVAGDWRLPNVRELQSLIHYGFNGPALSDAAGTAKWTTNGDAFTNVESSGYWSSTTNGPRPSFAWFVGFGNGSVGRVNKTGISFVLPVRGS